MNALFATYISKDRLKTPKKIVSQWPHQSFDPLRHLLHTVLRRPRILFEDTQSGTATGETDISLHITNMTDTSGRTLNDILKRSLLRSFSSSAKRKQQRRRKSLESRHHCLVPPEDEEGELGDVDSMDGLKDDASKGSILFDDTSRARELENILVLQSLSGPDPFLENMGCHVEMGAEALGILLDDISEKFHDDIGNDDVSVLSLDSNEDVSRDVMSDGSTARAYKLDVGNSSTEANFPNLLPIILPGKAICTYYD